MATLDQQSEYLRRLLFEELREAAKQLAGLADDAAQAGTDRLVTLAGDEAYATLHYRVMPAADALDALGGWWCLPGADLVDLHHPAAPNGDGHSRGCAPGARQEGGE